MIDFSSVANVVIGGLIGGLGTSAIAFLRVGVPITKLQTQQVHLQKTVDDNGQEHREFIKSTVVTDQLTDIVARLGRIEDHMMNGSKK